MGIVLGISDMIVGVAIAWQTGRYRRILKGRILRGRQMEISSLLFIGWGVLLILLCVVTRGKESVLEFLTYLAGLGAVMLVGSVSNIKILRACKMETTGIFIRFQPMLGLPAFFEYEVSGRKYRGLSQSCNIEKYRNEFVEGERYRIYVNEKKPEQFVAAKRIEPADILTAGLGLACAGVWAAYIAYRVWADFF